MVNEESESDKTKAINWETLMKEKFDKFDKSQPAKTIQYKLSYSKLF